MTLPYDELFAWGIHNVCVATPIESSERIIIALKVDFDVYSVTAANEAFPVVRESGWADDLRSIIIAELGTITRRRL